MAPNINTDFENLWNQIASKTLPPGLKPNIGVLSDPTSWVYAIKRDAVTRRVYYTGTCTGQEAIQSAQTGSFALGVSGQAADTAASMIAKGSNAIPIIGSAVSAFTSIISSIIQHHAIAVRNEQQAECAVAQITAETIPQIDAVVASGQLTAQQGIQAHAQMVSQCKQILAPVSGVGDASHPCNAGCVFGFALDGLQMFAEVYYMELTPLSTTAPVAPATWSATPPNSTQKAFTDYAVPPSGSPVMLPDGSMAVLAPGSNPTGFPWGFLLFSILALGVVIYFVREL